MVSSWPVFQETLRFDEEEVEFERVIAAIRGIRNRRSEMNVPPSKKAKLFILTADRSAFEAGLAALKKLAYA